MRLTLSVRELWVCATVGILTISTALLYLLPLVPVVVVWLVGWFLECLGVRLDNRLYDSVDDVKVAYAANAWHYRLIGWLLATGRRLLSVGDWYVDRIWPLYTRLPGVR